MNMTTVPSNQIKAMQHEIADLKEQLAHLRIEADFNFEQYQDACRLMFELKEVTEQQAEAIRLKDEALEHVGLINDGLCGVEKIRQIVRQAIAIQPSPDILQARDERVAKAIAKMTDEVCSLLQTDDKSDDYVAGVGNAVTSVEESIERGEWRKYL